MLRWIGWTLIRIVVTLACVWTVWNIVHHEGYYIPYTTMLAGAVATIVAVRFWMPKAG